MRNKIKFHHLLLIGAVALGSCQKEYVKPVPVTPPPPAGSIKFSTDIVPIFTAHCSMSGCHDGSGAPVNLSPSTAYADLFANNEIDTVNDANSNLYVRMTAVGNPMPPTGLISAAETAKVLAWIKDGAKNN